jgi:putative peptide zinc metalloprotease protein
VLGVLAALLRLVALVLPVVGSLLVAQKLLRTSTAKARAWSAGRPGRRAVAIAAAVAVAAGLAWAWWPSGQYHPVRAADRGTLPSLVQLLGHPRTAVRASAGPAPRAARPAAQPATVLPPGTHLVLAAVPRGGATAEHPALLVLPGASGRPPAAVAVPDSSGTGPLTGVAFPFRLPAAPGPGDTQALATGTRDGGVVYTISYALVTVPDGAPVTQTNSAFALARCTGCTTVAVSFQVVLVVGTSHAVAPIDAAGALDVDCPACVTTAIAEQMVVTVARQPSAELEQQLRAALSRLGALPQLGAEGSPQAVLAAVQAVQQQVGTVVAQSGLTVGGGATSSAATATAGTGAAAEPTSTPGSEPSATGTATPSRTAASTTRADGTAGSAADEATPTDTAAATTTSP